MVWWFEVRFALQCAEAFVVTCIVELAMALPMAMYFHRITLFALPVNLFILPRDAGAYRTWMYLGLALLPLSVLCAFVVW